MNRHDALLGAYVPRDSVVHRWPVWWKYLLVFGASLPTVFFQSLWLSLVVALTFAVILMLSRLGWRTAFGMGKGLILVVVATVCYGGFFATWRDGLTLGLTMVGCLWGARMLTCTTPAPALIDALIAGARPLRWLGLSPERFGLAVGLMVRSIPYLFGAFDDVRDAARARGLERHLRARITPVVIRAVAYAHDTGAALAARGLGDD